MKTTLLLLLIVSCVYGRLIPSISFEREHYRVGLEHIKVNWSIYNDDSFPALVMKYGTPLEGTVQNTLTTDMFEILNEDGISPIYTGILMKRAQPTISDYEVIKGNSEVSGEIILSDAYHFEVDGTYTIKLATSRSDLLITTPLESNQVTITISGAFPFEYKGSPSLAVDFTGCSTSQTSTVNTAISNAISASSAAVSYLNRGCTSAYVTWFGTYSSGNYGTVKSNFNSINSNLSGKNFGVDCSTCKQPGTYAYVYPSDPSKTIYLCSVFWNSPSNEYSYNSQPGTLTHEMSHFTAVAGTNDYQYGVSGCLSLAKSTPSRAIANADSYEYFQESNPNGGAC